ncbi:DUF6352 family protein [Halodurantibacterium flavum]|uniref:DUF6352 family protein n=1 Tax=Halodurantibacterium flavum TaxID=1382802 RepID=A0ABW4SA17_9RHOB
MREFWVASGHHLTRLDEAGRMIVTDELLLAWLARPEIIPPDDACAAERALYARLRQDPRAPVPETAIAALADRDAQENWRFLAGLRDTLVMAGTVEAAYLALVREGRRMPVVFYDQLVQLILRNALQGCEDVHTLRAAELMFRAQRGHVRDGALMLADEELVSEMEAERHQSPLTAMLSGGVEGLDVLTDANAWTYWSRSDAHTMVLNFGGDPRARQGLADAMAAFVRHLLGEAVRVSPKVTAEGVDLRWFVGLDQTGTAIGNALWHGTTPEGTIVGLFTLEFEDNGWVLPSVQGHPVWLILGLDEGMSLRMKPQNLVMGLPLAEGRALH